VAQAAKAYDIALVQFHGTDVKLNFAFSEPWPGNAPDTDRHVAREDREAHERLEAAKVDEEYLKELREKHPKRVAQEAGGL
jgi:hypothetical protein